MSAHTARSDHRPAPAELLSIAERSRTLLVLRACIGVVAVALTVLHGVRLRDALVPIAIGACVSVVLATVPLLLGGRSRTAALSVLRATLLLDGILFAAGIAVTGGAASPLRVVLFAHVIGVILVISYRTGSKLALWHTLLYLLVVEAQRAELFRPALPGSSDGSPSRTALATVSALWILALATSAFAALSERELRRQKVDLERLSGMVGRIEAAGRADDIPPILLEELCATFGFCRGIVLASPEGMPTLMASLPEDDPTEVPIRIDSLMERAWSERSVVAVRTIHPETDPTLAAMLPEATNLLVIPMLGDRGRRLGIAVVERGGHDEGIRGWVVAMVAQFTAHAALALENAWLSEERQRKLDEIRRLQDELRAHNDDLERIVDERTEELRTAIAELEEMDRQRRRLLDHVVRATEEERRRIANDVHDDPVQKMIAVKMRLELLRKTHPELEDVHHALEVVRNSIASLRHLLFDLRPPILDEQGLAPALRTFLENAEATFRWQVEDGLTKEPSSQSRVILYRIAQEALTNARKHSQADHVRVVLGERDGGIEMEISDDGVGFMPQDAIVAAPGHMGLAAMRERAEMSGGWCELRSLPDAGTTLTVWLPAGEDHPEEETVEPPAELDLGIRSA